jgi:hypothetical protein
MPLPVVSAIRLLASSTQPDLGDGGRALALSSMCAAGPGSAGPEVRESAICLLLSNIQVEADTWTLRSSHAPLAPGRAPVLPSWPGQRPEVVVLARLPAGHHAEGPVPGEPHPAAGESPAPVSLIRQVTRVPDTVLSRVNACQPATPLQPVPAADPPLTIDGKSAIVFVSEESCPFCAAERWQLTVALSHFGTWSHLGSTRSSATDVYPSTATPSFRAARYASPDLSLRTTELTDNLGRPPQAQTSLDVRLIDTQRPAHPPRSRHRPDPRRDPQPPHGPQTQNLDRRRPTTTRPCASACRHSSSMSASRRSPSPHRQHFVDQRIRAPSGGGWSQYVRGGSGSGR